MAPLPPGQPAARPGPSSDQTRRPASLAPYHPQQQLRSLLPPSPPHQQLRSRLPHDHSSRGVPAAQPHAPTYLAAACGRRGPVGLTQHIVGRQHDLRPVSKVVGEGGKGEVSVQGVAVHVASLRKARGRGGMARRRPPHGRGRAQCSGLARGAVAPCLGCTGCKHADGLGRRRGRPLAFRFPTCLAGSATGRRMTSKFAEAFKSRAAGGVPAPASANHLPLWCSRLR